MRDGHGLRVLPGAERPGAHAQGGWTVPLVCMALMAGAAGLAGALQQTLSDQERLSRVRWQSLQAQAVGEGLLSRTLALLDESGTVDEACRVTAVGPVPIGERFAQRMVKAGTVIACRVDLQGAPGIQAWSCQCPLGSSATAATSGATSANASGSSSTSANASVWAQLRMEPAAAPMLRVVLMAAVTDVQPFAASLDVHSGPTWQLTVLLKPDASGAWRQVVGSWNDGP